MKIQLGLFIKSIAQDDCKGKQMYKLLKVGDCSWGFLGVGTLTCWTGFPAAGLPVHWSRFRNPNLSLTSRLEPRLQMDFHCIVLSVTLGLKNFQMKSWVKL